MRTELHVLDSSGDLRLSWDPTNPEEVAEARQAVLDLKARGFQFFLIDGSPAPADDPTRGHTALSCRRVEAAELLPAETEAPARRRGRPPGAKSKPKEPGESGEPVRAVATRPLAGGW